jgi:hypothetical protein
MLDAAAQENAMSAADAVTVVVATTAADVVVETIVTAIVPNVLIARRAQMPRHQSPASHEAIALLASHALRVKQDLIVHRASHAKAVKNNVSHANQEPNVHRALRANHVQIVQICANHAKGMHKHQPQQRKDSWMRKRCRHLLKVKSSKPRVNNVSHANAAVVTAMVVIADLNAQQTVRMTL